MGLFDSFPLNEYKARFETLRKENEGLRGTISELREQLNCSSTCTGGKAIAFRVM